MRKIAITIASAVLFISAATGVARADEEHRHGDIHEFHHYDMDRWHGGHWAHTFHEGRHGWWWIVGGTWYYYPAPVYPYPDPYVPPSVIVTQPTETQQYWYCANPAGYYPYVSACYVQWQMVPATSVVQQPPMPVIPLPPANQQQESQRDMDDRELDNLAAEYYQINPAERRSLQRLRDLEARVETFRQSLFERNYNAMDILKNTEDLERRIREKEAKAY